MSARYFVGRGLSRAEAKRRAWVLHRPRDYRGFSYNGRTGWAVFI